MQRLLQPIVSPQRAEVADVCLSITLGDSSKNGSLPPAIAPLSGLQVCRCDSSQTCIDKNTPAAAAGSQELQICLISHGDDNLVDVSFLQLDYASGESMVISLDNSNGGNMDSTAIDELVQPNAVFDLHQDGQSGVITFLMDDELFDLLSGSSATSFTLSGMVLFDNRDEVFQLELDFSTKEADPSQGCGGESLDPLEELNLSNTNEVAGCNCQTTLPTQAMALAPLPPKRPVCPSVPLVSTPKKNEITL